MCRVSNSKNFWKKLLAAHPSFRHGTTKTMSEEYKNIQLLRQFSTAPHPCSYLPDQEASTLVIDPEAKITQQNYSYLIRRGYRRSGQYLYKPDCAQCKACLSLRIPVKQYVFSRNDK